MARTNYGDLILWAESPEEARIFLERARRQALDGVFSQIYVAKRSSKIRSNNYIAGQYHRTSNDDEVTVFQETVVAPAGIINLVQWCTCDVMISRGVLPLMVVEDTTHIVRMNVYQRVPRLFLAAMQGVPAIALQGTRGLDFSLRGDCWGFHRYMRAFASISRLYLETPALPFFYIPSSSDQREEHAEEAAFKYIKCVLGGDQAGAAEIRNKLLAIVNEISRNGFMGHIARDIPCIEVTQSQVVVNVGANPDKKSWAEKGSGQMDPYIGLIAAAKYIYCFDELTGMKTKDMIVRFTKLPKDFWWFKDWKTSTSLYKTLAFKIADKVEFLGQQSKN